jgi:hypothetical protein
VFSKRNTFAIDHHHPLCAPAPLGLSDSSAPFFADPNLPSIKPSLQSSCPFLFNCPRKARQIFSQTHAVPRRVNAASTLLGTDTQHAGAATLRHFGRSTKYPQALGGYPPKGAFPAYSCSLGNKGSIFSHCPSVSIGPPRGISDSSCRLIAHSESPIQVPPSIPNQVMKLLLVVRFLESR